MSLHSFLSEASSLERAERNTFFETALETDSELRETVSRIADEAKST